MKKHNNGKTALIVAASLATLASGIISVRAITSSVAQSRRSYQEAQESEFIRERREASRLVASLKADKAGLDTFMVDTRDPMVPYEPPVEEEISEVIEQPKPVWPRNLRLTAILGGDSSPRAFFEHMDSDSRDMIHGSYGIGDTIPGTEIIVSDIYSEGMTLQRGSERQTYEF